MKYNNGDKDSKTVQRKKRGHIKNKYEMADFSIAKREGPEARQLVTVGVRSGAGRLTYCRAIFLPRTIREAGKSIF